MQDQATDRTILPQRLRRQQGYSVVELSIALSIIAILTVAGLAGVQNVLNTNKSNNQIEQSGQTIAKLASSYQGQTSTSGATQASVAGLGIWPSSRVTAAGVATNLFGGNEFVAPNSAITVSSTALTANTYVVYYLQNIPKAACSDVANALAPLANAVSVITTPATAATAATFPVTGTPAPVVKGLNAGSIDTGLLGSACAGATSTVDIAFLIKP